MRALQEILSLKDQRATDFLRNSNNQFQIMTSDIQQLKQRIKDKGISKVQKFLRIALQEAVDHTKDNQIKAILILILCQVHEDGTSPRMWVYDNIRNLHGDNCQICKDKDNNKCCPWADVLLSQKT